MKTRMILVAGALVTVAAGAVAAGQAQRTPATLDDVVNEVRALRADLRQANGVTARMQLLTARLSLQEQRITVLANQRADVSARLAVEARLRADAERQVAVFTESVSRNTELGISRAELEAQERMFKGTLALHRDAELQL